MVQRRSTGRPARRRKAATADVIGASSDIQQVPAQWQKHYKHLVELRDFLLDCRVHQVKDAAEEHPAFSLHMADAGTDSFDRDFALSRISSEQDALYEIDQALGRIREGTYGICELTGKRIEAGRLQAIPWTRFSTAAELQLERDGVVRRARVSPREAVARGSGPEGESGGLAEDEQLQEE